MESITKHEARLIERHYRRKLHRGKNTFARWVDYIAFRLLMLAAAYLWLMSIMESAGLAISLAVIAVTVVCVALELYQSFRFDMFVASEKRRMAERYVLEELMLMSPAELASLAKSKAEDRYVAVRQSVKPLDADALLGVYREAREAGAERCVLVATAKLTAEAETFAERLPDAPISVMDSGELLKLAEAAGVFPDDGVINGLILKEYRKQKELRKKTVRAPFSRERTRRYLIFGALLIAASFIANYALYYRLLGSVCLTFAAISRFADRGD